MKIAITYSIIPSFGESSSLHLQYDRDEDSRAKYWTHFGGIGAEGSGATPWWIGQKERPSEPQYLIEQTTNLIMNMITGLRICPSPEFVEGGDGTLYELEFYAGINKVKYVWWVDLPEAWGELSSITAFLDGFLKGSQP